MPSFFGRSTGHIGPVLVQVTLKRRFSLSRSLPFPFVLLPCSSISVDAHVPCTICPARTCTIRFSGVPVVHETQRRRARTRRRIATGPPSQARRVVGLSESASARFRLWTVVKLLVYRAVQLAYGAYYRCHHEHQERRSLLQICAATPVTARSGLFVRHKYRNIRCSGALLPKCPVLDCWTFAPEEDGAYG